MVDFHLLFDRYLNGKISAEEFEVLLSGIRSGNIDDLLAEKIDSILNSGEIPENWPNDVTEMAERNRLRLREKTLVQSSTTKKRAYTVWFRLPHVAAVLLAVSIFSWFIIDLSKDDIVAEHVAVNVDPGGNRATLTLANGNTISLSESQSGIMMGEFVTYTDGSIISDKMNDVESLSQQMALSTPKGGTYQVVLPDGSEVWLNAASTLNYPSRFAENERTVYLEGEAYFSVKRLTSKISGSNTPFNVVANGQTIEVTGTEFNVSAYLEEYETSTTLVEGSVLIDGTTLLPGQQATTTNGKTTVRAADLESVLAWKKGYFRFNNEPLADIVRKLSRWYDIDIVCKRGAELQFGGSVSRYSNLSEVLEMLELTETIHFRMENGQLIAE